MPKKRENLPELQEALSKNEIIELAISLLPFYPEKFNEKEVETILRKASGIYPNFPIELNKSYKP